MFLSAQSAVPPSNSAEYADACGKCHTGCCVQDGSVYGVALNAGVRSKAALLPQSTRTHLRNAHLEPSPRGALADLKPVQNAKDEPGVDEIKVWQCTLPRYISQKWQTARCYTCSTMFATHAPVLDEGFGPSRYFPQYARQTRIGACVANIVILPAVPVFVSGQSPQRR